MSSESTKTISTKVISPATDTSSTAITTHIARAGHLKKLLHSEAAECCKIAKQRCMALVK